MTYDEAVVQAHAAAIAEFGQHMHPEDVQAAPLELRGFIKKCDECSREELDDLLRFVSEALRNARTESLRDRRYRAIRGPFEAYAKASMKRRFGIAA